MGFDLIQERLRNFTIDRNWECYHSPKNLSMALSCEVGELLEIFQWKTQKESCSCNVKEVEEELADIVIYVLLIADKYNIDLIEAMNCKIDKNIKKYPVSDLKK